MNEKNPLRSHGMNADRREFIGTAISFGGILGALGLRLMDVITNPVAVPVAVVSFVVGSTVALVGRNAQPRD